jgi:adenylate cyclase
MALTNANGLVRVPASSLARRLALAIGAIGLVLAVSSPVAELEQRFGLQWLFSLRGATPAPSEVVMLAINSQTIDALNLPEKPAQWSRDLHTRAIDRLREAGAAVIVFDLFFEESRAQDQALADVIRRAGNVVLIKKLVAESEAQQSATSILQQAARANAPFMLPRESVRVDGFWTFKSSADDLPTLPVAALQAYCAPAYGALRSTLIGLQAALEADLPVTIQTSADFFQAIKALRKTLAAQPDLLSRLHRAIDANPAVQPRIKQLARALLRAYGSDEAQFLNFFGPPSTLNSVAYHHIAGPSETPIDPALFKGKAVFIGYVPASWRDYEAIRDDYHTVYSRADGLRLSGVEIAATAFANLLAGSAIKPLATPRQMALFGLWGGAVGLLAGWLSIRRGALVLGLLGLGYLYWALFKFGHDQVWLPLVVPLAIQLPLAFLAATLVKYLQAKRQRQRVINVAKQFVPIDVLNRSLADAGPASPQTRLAYGVCLATDVKNYTRISETMEPQALANLMNDYFALVNGHIEARGGKIADMRGDAVLALWADTVGETELRRQACLAAIALRDALDEFNRAPNRPKLETRIGLHAGQVALGTIGAAGGHLEFRAVGDIVNTASRVEGLNKTLNTTLLATAEAAASVTDVHARPLGRFQLAGKSQPLDIVELVGPQTSPSNANYADFANALDSYYSGKLQIAEAQFAKLAQQWPHDGPTQFFVATCQRQLSDTNGAKWDATIVVDQK